MTVSAADLLHKPMATALRVLAMDAVQKANSGHPGMPMGMADVATVLWRHYLRFDPASPSWADRDRFILSGGHGSMLLYALAHLTGYAKITMDEIKNFRQWGSHTPGHPERDIDSAIEMTTGPLGQGIATAVGFALGERVMNARFGDELVDHRTFVFAGDGDMMEGISHEACSLAGHMKLGRLVVYYDDNKISIDGPTTLSFTENVQERFRSYGWHVQEIDGHDPAAIAAATEAALAVTDKPSLIACRTIIGCGAPNKQGTSGCHGSPLGADEVQAAREMLEWPYEPFFIPEDVAKAWRAAGTRCEAMRRQWEERTAKSTKRDGFLRVVKGELPAELAQAMTAFKEKIAADKPKVATRQSSGSVLEAIVPVMPELTGGSADLTPSNNTHVKGSGDILPPFFEGRYIRYGVREHGMAAIMNGLSLHGGIVPYGGTFMQFTDYCRPSIRLAALMKLRSIFVMTHDSIGLGEDGPTHQPVEHLSALRAIPNLLVLRPCDGIETAECWDIALRTLDAPSVLALSRHGLPTYRAADAENKSACGGYVLAGGEGARDVTLIATGSEVEIAMKARDLLAKDGVKAAVVSMPCLELFDRQSEAYRASVLGTCPRVVVEAGIRMSWDRLLGSDGAFIGLSDFGASAPANILYEKFGVTAEATATAAHKVLTARKG